MIAGNDRAHELPQLASAADRRRRARRCSGQEDGLVELLREPDAWHRDRLVLLVAQIQVDQRAAAHHRQRYQPMLLVVAVDENRRVVADMDLDARPAGHAPIAVEPHLLDPAQDPFAELELSQQKPPADLEAERVRQRLPPRTRLEGVSGGMIIHVSPPGFATVLSMSDCFVPTEPVSPLEGIRSSRQQATSRVLRESSLRRRAPGRGNFDTSGARSPLGSSDDLVRLHVTVRDGHVDSKSTVDQPVAGDVSSESVAEADSALSGSRTGTMGLSCGFHAAGWYSFRRPPRIVRRVIRRSGWIGIGLSGRGG